MLSQSVVACKSFGHNGCASECKQMSDHTETMLDLVDQLHQAIAADQWPVALELIAQLHILAKHLGANHEHTRAHVARETWSH